MIDSSRSVTSHIAKAMDDTLIQIPDTLFITARGSLTESMEHLATAFDEKYITEGELKPAKKNVN